MRREDLAQGGRPLIHPFGKRHRCRCRFTTACRRTFSADTLPAPECAPELTINAHLRAPISSSGHVRFFLRSKIPYHRFCLICEERRVAERRGQQEIERRITPDGIAGRRSETGRTAPISRCLPSLAVAGCCTEPHYTRVCALSHRSVRWTGQVNNFIGCREVILGACDGGRCRQDPQRRRPVFIVIT